MLIKNALNESSIFWILINFKVLIYIFDKETSGSKCILKFHFNKLGSAWAHLKIDWNKNGSKWNANKMNLRMLNLTEYKVKIEYKW